MIADDLSRIAMSSGLAASLSRATEHARARAHIEVTLEHMLLALCDDQDAVLVLAASNVNVAELVREVEGQLSVIAPHPQGQHGELLVAPDLRRILEAAAAAARGGRRREINGAIVLAAIVGDGKSVAAHVLGELGMTFEGAIRALQAKPAEPPPRSAPAPDAEAILANARERVQSRTAPPRRHAQDHAATPGPQAGDSRDGGEPAQPDHHYPADDAPDEAFHAEANADAAGEAFEPPSQPHGPPQGEPDFDPLETDGGEYAAPAHREGAAEQRHEPSDYRSTLPPILGQRARAPYGPDYEPEPEPEPEDEPDLKPATEFEPPPQGAPPPAFRRATPTANHYRPEPQRPDYGQGHGEAPVDSYGAEPVEPAFEGDAGAETYAEPDYGEPGVADYAAPAGYEDDREHGHTQHGGPPQMPAPASAPFPPPIPPPSPHDGWAPPPMPQPARPDPRYPAPPPGPSGAAAPYVPPPAPAAAGSTSRHGATRPPGPPPLAPWPEQASDPTLAARAEPSRGNFEGNFEPAMEYPGRDARPRPGPGRPVAARRAEIGQLVENIPRIMRIAMPAMIEVRIARADVQALAEGLQGGAAAYHHDITVAKAMSVRLRAPDGGFFIETASPETQWIEKTTLMSSDDFASWRWHVTPRDTGKRRLQLIISARTVSADGLAAETALPDQVITVRVRTNYAETGRRWVGWGIAAVAGGLLAKFGERTFDTWLPALSRLFGG